MTERIWRPFFSNDCDPGTGYVDNDLDCDDLNATAFPETQKYAIT